MIVGVGIDLVEIRRVQAILEKYGDAFPRRILRPDEISYCQEQANPAPSIAARFAAKEAVSKAFGTGIGAQLGWHDMEITRSEHGEPGIRLHGTAQALMAQRKAQRVWISLTHAEHYAAAVAVLEGG